MNEMVFKLQPDIIVNNCNRIPGDNVAFAGLRNKVNSVTLLASGQKVDFEQDDYRIRFKGLNEKAPDDPITTLAIECDSEPKQEELFVRRRERGQV